MELALPATLLVVVEEVAQRLLQQLKEEDAGQQVKSLQGGGISSSSSQPAPRGNLEGAVLEASACRSHGDTARIALGTGFMVSNSTAVTANHVVAHLVKGSAVYMVLPRSASPDRKMQVLQFILQDRCEDRDVAFLRLKEHQPLQQPLELYAGGDTVLDEWLHLATYHVALQDSLPWFDTSLGVTSADQVKLSQGEKGRVLYIARTEGGCSGSPLVTDNGDCGGCALLGKRKGRMRGHSVV